MCLDGLKFIVTGVLESIERAEAEDLIKRYGGKLVTSVTKSLDYAVVGDDAGPKKIEQIEQFRIKTLDEDTFFALIRTRQPPRSTTAAPPARKPPVASPSAPAPAVAVGRAELQDSQMQTTQPSSVASQSQPMSGAAADANRAPSW